MWTPTARRHHSRTGPQYDINLTDAEWVIMGLCCTPPSAACGRPTVWPMRVCSVAALRGGSCPRTCRPGARVWLLQPVAR